MVDCSICGCLDWVLLLEKDGCKINQCTNCHTAFTYPLPAESLDLQYDENYFQIYTRRQRYRARITRCRLRAIELITAPGKLLDVGCSLGYFVAGALQRGWKAKGVEISPFASEYARNQGLDVFTGKLSEACFPNNSFDCITMWDVLEHVQNPTAQLRECNRILGKGGLLIVATPDLNHVAFKLQKTNWRHLKPREHIYYFQQKNLDLLFEKTGFRAIRPPILGGRKFPGSAVTSLVELVFRIYNPKDVLTVYGVKETNITEG